jgi:hypothetical protein
MVKVNEVAWKVPCKCEGDLDAENDYKFCHAITVVPDTMLFYTYMERYDDQDLTTEMSLIPMGISWLRLLGTKDGWFAKGGYVRYLSEGDDARITVSRPSSKAPPPSAWVIEIHPSGRQAPVCRLYAETVTRSVWTPMATRHFPRGCWNSERQCDFQETDVRAALEPK